MRRRLLAVGATAPPSLAKELALAFDGAHVTLLVSRDRTTIDVARRLVDLIVERHVPRR